MRFVLQGKPLWWFQYFLIPFLGSWNVVDPLMKPASSLAANGKLNSPCESMKIICIDTKIVNYTSSLYKAWVFFYDPNSFMQCVSKLLLSGPQNLQQKTGSLWTTLHIDHENWLLLMLFVTFCTVSFSSVFCTSFDCDLLHSTWEAGHRAVLHPLGTVALITQ